jgi:hypothetical protein
MKITHLGFFTPAQDATETVANYASPPIYVIQPVLPPPYLQKIWAFCIAIFAPAIATINAPAT